jgi:hypothetical protein
MSSTPTPAEPTPAVPTPALPATILSYSRAYVTAAKNMKREYWGAELIATLLSLSASLVPWAAAAAALGVMSVAAKATGKLLLSKAKKQFRVGERQRRYDFYMKALGWPPPASDRADTYIANSSSKIREAAQRLAPREANYYAHQGTPGKERLFCNLAESMFWSERLFGTMATVWWKRFAGAAITLGLVLIATIILNLGNNAFLVLKCLGSVVALLVTLDVFAEARSSDRGEKEIGKLLRVLETEMARHEPSEKEALRILVEYNCVLADLPMIQDAVYHGNEDTLNAAWKEYETSLPFRCAVPSAAYSSRAEPKA